MMINRRTFTKAIAFIPLIDIFPWERSVDYVSLMRMFCGERFDHHRFDLSRFHFVSEYAYATNRYVMARVGFRKVGIALDEDRDFVNEFARKIVAVWEKHFVPKTTFQPFRLAAVEELKPSKENLGICPLCFNRRISLGDDWPNLQSEYLNDFDYDIDDNTIRDSSCSLCHGRDYSKHCFQEVFGQLIQYRFVKMLDQLSGCEVAIGNEHTILFRSSCGIEGIVMPCNVEGY